MSERFKNIYSIEEDLYTQGAPVIIKSGKLCRDIRGGDLVCLFNFLNISDKTVKSLKLVFDFGEYLYDGLCATRDTEFGSDIRITVEDLDAKSFSCCIEEVAFTDGTFWQGKDKVWTPVPVPMTLEKQLGDEDLVREFRNKYGNDAVYFPYEAGDIWYCCCGALNHGTESACHNCNRTLAGLKKYGAEELQNIIDREKRLKNVNKEVFEEAYRNVEINRKARKSRTALYIVILAVVITVIAALIAMDDDHYTQAVPRLESDYCEKL